MHMIAFLEIYWSNNNFQNEGRIQSHFKRDLPILYGCDKDHMFDSFMQNKYLNYNVYVSFIGCFSSQL